MKIYQTLALGALAFEGNIRDTATKMNATEINATEMIATEMIATEMEATKRIATWCKPNFKNGFIPKECLPCPMGLLKRVPRPCM